MGPFLVAARQLKFLIVGIDYFTKWVEAEALATITEKNVRSFVWRHIICRYEIPRVLVSDYEKQFNDSFKDFCLQLGIKNHYSCPAHPQANGQVEITNQSLLKLSRLGSMGQRVYGPKSFQACYGILDSGQNTTGETLFRLAYGREPIIPTEVGLTSYKVDNHDEEKNNEAMRL